MRVVVQRVKKSEVEVKGVTVGIIGHGLLIFLGVGLDDSKKDCEYLANKIAHLRIFQDSKDLMNLSLMDIRGSVMVVSQFTLWGDCRKGRRPSFVRAARPERANDKVLPDKKCFQTGLLRVFTRKFQEMMDVRLVNDGPVTLMLDSRKSF